MKVTKKVVIRMPDGSLWCHKELAWGRCHREVKPVGNQAIQTGAGVVSGMRGLDQLHMLLLL